MHGDIEFLRDSRLSSRQRTCFALWIPQPVTTTLYIGLGYTYSTLLTSVIHRFSIVPLALRIACALESTTVLLARSAEYFFRCRGPHLRLGHRWRYPHHHKTNPTKKTDFPTGPAGALAQHRSQLEYAHPAFLPKLLLEYSSRAAVPHSILNPAAPQRT